jgi:hypothetical protein
VTSDLRQLSLRRLQTFCKPTDRHGWRSRIATFVLSPNLLHELRQHYRRLQRKPAEWLFSGGRWHTAEYPITTKVVWYACRKAAQRASIEKR